MFLDKAEAVAGVEVEHLKLTTSNTFEKGLRLCEAALGAFPAIKLFTLEDSLLTTDRICNFYSVGFLAAHFLFKDCGASGGCQLRICSS
jgi:hypothetical protein